MSLRPRTRDYASGICVGERRREDGEEKGHAPAKRDDARLHQVHAYSAQARPDYRHPAHSEPVNHAKLINNEIMMFVRMLQG